MVGETNKKIKFGLTLIIICAVLIIAMPKAYADEDTAAIEAVEVTDETNPPQTVEVTNEDEIKEELAPDSANQSEIDAVEISFENTETENAIQLAIDASLAGADGKDAVKTVTIVVGEGEYGELNISNANSQYDLADDFVLEIIAEDAIDENTGDATTEGGGLAEVAGNINVEDINVLLAGLYIVGDGVVNAKNASVNIMGTEADDEITLVVSDGAQFDLETGDGDDTVVIKGDESGGTPDATDVAEINANAGAGDDVIVVDTSASQTTQGETNIIIEGGEGTDELHLTGELSETEDSQGERTGINNENADIDIKTDLDKTLNVDTANVEIYVEDLKNKKEVEVTVVNNVCTIAAPTDFTDFIITDYPSDDVVVNMGAATPFLSSLIINADSLTIKNLAANNLTVEITGEDITINGNIIAENIYITAEDTDVQFSFEYESAVIPDVEVEFSLFDCCTDAKVTIAAAALLTASQIICIKAISEQTQPLVPDLTGMRDDLQTQLDGMETTNPDRQEVQDKISKLNSLIVNPNFVNVKVGNAEIDIMGMLSAIWDIDISTDALVEMEITNEELANLYVPLGVGVAVTDSLISIDGSSIMSASGDINVSANSDVTMTTMATTGKIPFTLALSVADINCRVDMSNSTISALNGSAEVSSSGSLSVDTIATSQVPGDDDENSNASGGFVALSIIMQDVGTKAVGNGAISAGNVYIRSCAKEIVNTSAVSNNDAEEVDEDDDGDVDEDEDGYSMSDMVNIILKLFDRLTMDSDPMVEGEAGEAMNSAGDEIAPEDDDDMGLTQLFDEGTSGAGDEADDPSTPEEETSSSMQLVGALAVTYAKNSNEANINTTGSIISTGELSVEALAEHTVSTAADGSPIESGASDDPATTCIGVGIGVAVVKNSNIAYINAGSIDAGGLSICAQTDDMSSSVEAVSGESESDIGIAGSVAINIVSSDTSATLASSVVIDGGSVSISAEQTSAFDTTATTTSDGVAGKVGVGAGVAVAVIGCDVSAFISENAEIINTIEELSITAKYEGEENIYATAGSTGGTALVPVLALNVSGVAVKSEIGSSATQVDVAGDAVFEAISLINRNAGTDADAAGSEAAVGAVFLINITNDTARTKMKRLLKANNVFIKAKSLNAQNSSAKASASGAESNKDDGNDNNGDESEGEADEQADKSVSAAESLSDEADSENINSSAISGLCQDRQKAETSEGKISVAACFVLNIQENISEALIADSADTEARDSGEDTGTISVRSINKTDSNLSANAAAVSSSMGVGVAVAINMVTYSNTAKIGDSRITAKNLLLEASMKDDDDEDGEAEGGDEEEDNSLNAMLTDLVSEFLKDAIGEIANSLSLGSIYSGSSVETIVGDMIESASEAFITTLTTDTGLDGIFQNDLETLLNEKMEYVKGLPAAQFEDAKTTLKNAILAEIQDRFNKMLNGESFASFDVNNLSSSLSTAVKDYLKDAAKDIVAELTKDLVDIDRLRELFQGSLVEFAREKAKESVNAAASAAGASVTNAALGKLNEWLGEDTEVVFGHTIMTEAISGAGAGKVGIAGVAAITMLTGTTSAQIENRASLLLVDDIKVSEQTEIITSSAHNISNTASSAVGDDGHADQNEDAVENANGDSTGGSTPEITDVEQTGDKSKDGVAKSPSTANSTEVSGAKVGVGAAFSLNLINITAKSSIGEFRKVETGVLALETMVENLVETIAVSGSDPVEGGSGAAKVSIDASVAVCLIDTQAIAKVDEGASVITLGGDDYNVNKSDVEDLDEFVNTYISAEQRGTTLTKASGFSTGTSVAVGAGVAVNIADSNIDAAFNGTGQLGGTFKIRAITINNDDSHAIATAVGADMQKYANKLQNFTGTAQEKVNAAANGDFSTAGDENDSNDTASAINNKLDDNANSEGDANTGRGADNSAPISTNALNALDAKTENDPDTNEADGAVSGNANNGDGQSVDAIGSNTETSGTGQSVRVAASVAVNITAHSACVSVNGNITTTALYVISDNKNNFSTMGTSAAVSLSNNSNSIGMGVAVTVNKCEAVSHVGGTVNTTVGDLEISASQTQNMDGKYKGLIGSQALAGAVSGSDGKACISGAVAIIVAKSKTEAKILESAQITAGDVIITSFDKSKLAVRAGALSISKGSSVGAGVSFALIYAHNNVNALIGDSAKITARSLKMSAKKEKVDFSDFELAFDKSTLASVSETTASDDDDNSKAYSIEFGFKTDTVLQSVNLLNFLSSTNYYVEAISGAVNGGSGMFTGAGSLAFVFFYNKTISEIGNSVTITLTNGSMDVEAASDTTARVIAGALSASKSSVGVGVTVAVISNEDIVSALVGTSTTITITNGGANILASALSDFLIITVAVAATKGTGIGGSINVLLTTNDVDAGVGASSTISSSSDLNISAVNSAELLLVTLSAGVSSGGAAAGGTVAVIITGNEAQALIGASSSITSTAGNVSISSKNKEKLLNILASLSASGGGAALAGTVCVQITRSKALIIVGDGASITANKDLNMYAESLTEMFAIMAAVSATAGSTAAGASVNVNLFTREASITMGDSVSLTATTGNIIIEAYASDEMFSIIVAGALSSSTALSGCIPIVIGESTVGTTIGDFASLTATAGSILINAELKSDILMPAASISGSGSSAIGATVCVIILENTVESIVGFGSSMYAGCTIEGLYVSVRGESKKRKGIIVLATATEDIMLIDIAAGAAGSTAFSGAVCALIIDNNIRASIGQKKEGVTYNTGDKTSVTTEGSDGDIEVDADDEASVFSLVGALAVSGSTGIGVSVVALIFSRNVYAGIEAGSKVTATGDVIVNAKAYDDLFLLSIAFAASGSTAVSGDASIVLFNNVTKAAIGGEVDCSKNISVTADSKAEFIFIGAGVALSGTAAAVAVGVITYYYNETHTLVYAKADLDAVGRVDILAKSYEDIFTLGAGAAGSGGVAISGTVNVLFYETKTIAETQDEVKIEGSEVSIKADDYYEILGIVGSLAGGGTAGVGISALVAIVYSTVTAKLGDNNTVTSTSGSIEIIGMSKKHFDSYAVTASVSGTISVSVAVSVLVLGGKLTEDTNDIFHEDADDGYNGHFNMDAHVNEVFGSMGTKANESKSTAEIDGKLDSDGKNAEEHSQSGGSFAETESNDNISQEQMGDNAKGKATSDTDSFANRGGTAPTYDGKDATLAKVGSGTKITSADDINIMAEESMKIDVITGVLAISGGGGIGVGVAIGILNANIIAQVEDTAVLHAADDITIIATSVTENLDDYAADSDKKDMYDGAEKKDLNLILSNYSVRLITVSIGGGTVGVSAAVSYIAMYTNTKAIMAGDVTKADSVTVKANSTYGAILPLTLGISAGLAAISASVAIVVYEATVEASICSSAVINNVNNVYVKSYSDTTAMAIATAFAGGVGAVNGASAVAINKTRVDTFIGQGVIVNAGNVYVESDIITGAKTKILSIALGGLAVGCTVSIVMLNPEVCTYIGKTPYGTVLAHSTGTGGKIETTGDINVENYARGDAEVWALSVAAGGFALNGTVGLAFNNIVGYAAANGISLDANNINVTAVMDGVSEVVARGLTGGIVAGGLIIGIATISSDNTSLFDITGATVDANNITVSAGGLSGEEYKSTATVDVKTATVGAAAIAINIAFTINSAKNCALVTGSSGKMTANSLNIEANGWTQTTTTIKGISAGVLAIALSVSLAILQSYQEASLTGDGTYILGSLNVESNQNIGKSTLYDSVAYIYSGGGGLISVSGQIGLVISNATSIAKAGAKSLTVTGALNVKNNARSYAHVILKKVSVSAVAVGVMYGQANAAGYFLATVGCSGANIKADGINITTSYDSKSTVDITPADGKVKASLLSIEGNIGYARITTKAYAGITGSGAKIESSKAITVLAEGRVKADAKVHGVKMAVGMVNVAINIVEAKLAATQHAYINNAKIITTGSGTDGNVTINSRYNTPDLGSSGATASVGSSGGAEVSLVSAKVNRAKAISASDVRAYAYGISTYSGSEITSISGGLIILCEAVSYASADLIAPAASIGLVNITTSKTEAYAQGKYQAYITLNNTNSGVRANYVSIKTICYTKAESKVGTNGSLAEVSGITLKANEAYSYVKSESFAGINGTGDLYTNLYIYIEAEGVLDAISAIGEPSFSLSVMNIAINITNARVSAKQTAEMDVKGTVAAGTSILVDSELINKSKASSGNSAKGNDDGDDLKISIVGGDFNTANVLSASVNEVNFSGSNIQADNIRATATTNTIAEAAITQPNSVSLVSIGHMSTWVSAIDEVTIRIGDATGYTTNIKTNGDMTVKSLNHSDVTAHSLSPGFGVSGISLPNIAAKAYNGYTGLGKTSQIIVGRNAVLDIGNDLKLEAANTGITLAKIDSGIKLSFIELSLYTEAVNYSYYVTKITIKESAKLHADGDIIIYAHDMPSVRAEYKSTSFSFVSLSFGMSAAAQVVQNCTIDIEKSAIIEAVGNVDILITTNSDVTAKAYVNGGGLVSVKDISANIYVNRTSNIYIRPLARIASTDGNISIKIVSGGHGEAFGNMYTEKISAIVKCSQGGIFTGTSLAVDARVIDANTINVYSGACIESADGTTEIRIISSKIIQGRAFVSGGGFTTSTTTGVFVLAGSYSYINIGVGSGYSKANISGKTVIIQTVLGAQYLVGMAKPEISSAFSGVKAFSTVAPAITLEVNISNANIIGNDIHVCSSAKDNEGVDPDVLVTAWVDVDGLIDLTEAQTFLTGGSTTNVILGLGAVFYGTTINIDREVFDYEITFQSYDDGDLGAMIVSFVGDAGSVSVNPDVTFYMGINAQPITIIVYSYSNVKSYGIDESDLAVSHITTGGANLLKLDLAASIENSAGNAVLTVDGNLNGNKIYKQTSVAIVNIVNHSTTDLWINHFDMEDADVNITVNAANNNYVIVGATGSTGTSMNITSFNSTDVWLGAWSGDSNQNLINLHNGTMDILWTNAGGNLYIDEITFAGKIMAALWTSRLNVIGADYVGGASGNGTVYLTVNDGAAPTINIDTAGDLDLSITFAQVEYNDTMPTEFSGAQLNIDEHIDNIVTDGNLNLTVEISKRIYIENPASGQSISNIEIREALGQEIQIGYRDSYYYEDWLLEEIVGSEALLFSWHFFVYEQMGVIYGKDSVTMTFMDPTASIIGQVPVANLPENKPFNNDENNNYQTIEIESEGLITLIFDDTGNTGTIGTEDNYFDVLGSGLTFKNLDGDYALSKDTYIYIMDDTVADIDFYNDLNPTRPGDEVAYTGTPKFVEMIISPSGVLTINYADFNIIGNNARIKYGQIIINNGSLYIQSDYLEALDANSEIKVDNTGGADRAGLTLKGSGINIYNKISAFNADVDVICTNGNVFVKSADALIHLDNSTLKFTFDSIGTSAYYADIDAMNGSFVNMQFRQNNLKIAYDKGTINLVDSDLTMTGVFGYGLEYNTIIADNSNIFINQDQGALSNKNCDGYFDIVDSTLVLHALKDVYYTKIKAVNSDIDVQAFDFLVMNGCIGEIDLTDSILNLDITYDFSYNKISITNTNPYSDEYNFCVDSSQYGGRMMIAGDKNTGELNLKNARIYIRMYTDIEYIDIDCTGSYIEIISDYGDLNSIGDGGTMSFDNTIGEFTICRNIEFSQISADNNSDVRFSYSDANYFSQAFIEGLSPFIKADNNSYIGIEIDKWNMTDNEILLEAHNNAVIEINTFIGNVVYSEILAYTGGTVSVRAEAINAAPNGRIYSDGGTIILIGDMSYNTIDCINSGHLELYRDIALISDTGYIHIIDSYAKFSGSITYRELISVRSELAGRMDCIAINDNPFILIEDSTVSFEHGGEWEYNKFDIINSNGLIGIESLKLVGDNGYIDISDSNISISTSYNTYDYFEYNTITMSNGEVKLEGWFTPVSTDSIIEIYDTKCILDGDSFDYVLIKAEYSEPVTSEIDIKIISYGMHVYNPENTIDGGTGLITLKNANCLMKVSGEYNKIEAEDSIIFVSGVEGHEDSAYLYTVGDDSHIYLSDTPMSLESGMHLKIADLNAVYTDPYDDEVDLRFDAHYVTTKNINVVNANIEVNTGNRFDFSLWESEYITLNDCKLTTGGSIIFTDIADFDNCDVSVGKGMYLKYQTVNFNDCIISIESDDVWPLNELSVINVTDSVMNIDSDLYFYYYLMNVFNSYITIDCWSLHGSDRELSVLTLDDSTLDITVKSVAEIYGLTTFDSVINVNQTAEGGFFFFDNLYLFGSELYATCYNMRSLYNNAEIYLDNSTFELTGMTSLDLPNIYGRNDSHLYFKTTEGSIYQSEGHIVKLFDPLSTITLNAAYRVWLNADIPSNSVVRVEHAMYFYIVGVHTTDNTQELDKVLDGYDRNGDYVSNDVNNPNTYVENLGVDTILCEYTGLGITDTLNNLDEIKAALIDARWQEFLDKLSIIMENEARTFTVEIVECVYSGTIINDGDIYVKQLQGDMNLEIVNSKRGTIYLEAMAPGSNIAYATLLAKNVVINTVGNVGLDEWDCVDIEQNWDGDFDGIPIYNYQDISLRKAGDKYILEATVRFDVIEPVDCMSNMEINAGGDVWLFTSYDMYLGYIEAGGSVSITMADGAHIYDGRPANDTRKNVTATGEFRLSSWSMQDMYAPQYWDWTIQELFDLYYEGEGADYSDIFDYDLNMTVMEYCRMFPETFGSADDYIEVDVDGDMYLNLTGDIFVQDEEEITLYVETYGGVNVRCDKDINVFSDFMLTLGAIRSANGLVYIDANGNIEAGELYGESAHIVQDSVELVATGSIGTEDRPIIIDSGAGGFSSRGVDIYIRESVGDLLINWIETSGDVSLDTDGSITAKGIEAYENAVLAQQEANRAQLDADWAQTFANVLRNYLLLLEEELDKAVEKGDEEAVTQMQDMLDKYTIRAQAAQDEADRLQAEADDLQIVADNMRALAVGFGINCEGVLNVQAQGDITLVGNQTMCIENVETPGNVVLIVNDGNIYQMPNREMPSITAKQADIYALGGYDIGQSSNWMDVDVNMINAIGRNIYIKGYSAMQVGTIGAVGNLKLSAQGKMTGTDDNYMIAGCVEIRGHNLGEKSVPLVINAGYIRAGGNVIYMQTVSSVVCDAYGSRINIASNGDITGRMDAADVTIIANGYIGYEDDVLLLINNYARLLISRYGKVYTRLIYEYLYWQNRALEPRYISIFGVCLDSGEGFNIYILMGINEQGQRDVLGVWIGDDTGVYGTIFSELKERGVAEIDKLFISEEMIQNIFELDTLLFNTYLWAISNVEDLNDEYIEMLGDLLEVFMAETPEDTENAYDAFMQKWSGKYPQVAGHLEENFDNWQSFVEAGNDEGAVGYDLEFMFELIVGVNDVIINYNGIYTEELREFIINYIIGFLGDKNNVII